MLLIGIIAVIVISMLVGAIDSWQKSKAKRVAQQEYRALIHDEHERRGL